MMNPDSMKAAFSMMGGAPGGAPGGSPFGGMMPPMGMPGMPGMGGMMPPMGMPGMPGMGGMMGMNPMMMGMMGGANPFGGPKPT